MVAGAVAWHGEKVKMQLATELVKDDTAVELYVQTEDDVPVEIDKVTGEEGGRRCAGEQGI